MALPPAPNPMPPQGNLPVAVPPPPVAAGAPPLPGAAVPPPAAMPVPGAPTPGQPDMPMAEAEFVPPLTFLQQPWVQNALPIATSVVFHLGILIIGYVLVSRIPAIQRALKPTEEQII